MPPGRVGGSLGDNHTPLTFCGSLWYFSYVLNALATTIPIRCTFIYLVAFSKTAHKFPSFCYFPHKTQKAGERRVQKKLHVKVSDDRTW